MRWWCSLKLSEVMSLQMESHLSYSRKGMGWEICLQRRVYRKDSTLLINNRLSLYPYGTPPSLFVTGSLCFCDHTLSFSSVSNEKTEICRQLLKLRSVSSEVPWDILFMLVGWWCKSKKLLDVLLKRNFVCRERLFSALKMCVWQGSMCSQLSAQYSCLAEGGDVGIEWLFLSCSLTLAWLWRQGHPVKGGKRKVGQGREGKEEACWELAASVPHPLSCWCLSVCSALIVLVFLGIDHVMTTDREDICAKEM